MGPRDHERARSLGKMGRKGRISRRKPILQLDSGKKSEGSRVASTSGVSNVEYSQTESGTGTTITIKTTAQSQESEASGGQGQKSHEEKMDSEIANFLKEISALGNSQEGEEGEESATNSQDSSSNETADQSETSQDESEATQQVQQDSNPSDQPQGQSGTGQMGQEMKEKAPAEEETKESTEPVVTFWQSVIDPNTNHPYYWNPATNEVCWALPENGVISDEPLPEKGSKGGTSDGSAPNTYADYYAYYAQAYYGVKPNQQKPSDQPNQQGSTAGKKASSVPAATRADSGTSATVASSETAKAATKPQKAKKNLVPSVGKPEGEKPQSPVTAPILDPTQEGFVGPTLPSTASTDVAMEIGGKQDSNAEGESGGASNGTKDKEQLGKRAETQEAQQTPGAQGIRSAVSAEGGQKSEEAMTLRSSPQRQPVRTGQKRKASESEIEESPLAAAEGGPGAKKLRRSTLSPESNPPKKKVQVSASPVGFASKQAEQAMRLQVSMLADELSRKLQYLHVSNEGVSELQVLSIQLQTRLADWKDGGLSSKFLLGRFKQTTKDLQVYEEQAAPEGWSCVWDSASCRYQFRNTATGESSWEYPLQALLSPGSVEPQSSEISNQEETEASDQDVGAEGGGEKGEEGGQVEEEDEVVQTDDSSQQLLDQEMEEVSDGDFSSEPEEPSVQQQLPSPQPTSASESLPAKVPPPPPPPPLPLEQPQPQQQQQTPAETLEKVLTFLINATPEQQQQLFSQTQLTPEERRQMLAKARTLKLQKEQELEQQQQQQKQAPARQPPPPPPPAQQYQGPTAEYFYSAPEVPIPHRRNSRPSQEALPTQKGEEEVPEERELSVEEVRQRLQRSRRPLVSYEKEEPGIDVPGDEEEDEEQTEEAEEQQKNQPETGMEFISEFPPREPPNQKPRKPAPRKQSPPIESITTTTTTTTATAAATTAPPAPAKPLVAQPVGQSVSEEEGSKLRMPKGEVRFKVGGVKEARASQQKLSESSVPSISGAQAADGEATDGNSLQLRSANLDEKFRGLSSPPPEQLPTGQIVFSRDPRVAKRQQQLLQQAKVGDPAESPTDQEKASPPAEDKQQDGGEENEARMRERLLRRAKYRIRKASDKRGVAQSEGSAERPASGERGPRDSVEESTGIVEPCSKEKSLSPDVIELEDVSAQPSPSASDDVFGGAVGGGDGDGDAGEGRVEEGRVIVEPETGEQEAVLGGQSNTGESSERSEPQTRVTRGQVYQSPRASGGQSQTEEEGEILSSSPHPDHHLLPTTGRCYMDMEGYEGGNREREGQQTDRYESTAKYEDPGRCDDSYSGRSPEEYNRRRDSYRSGARQQQQQQQRSRSRSHSRSRSPDSGYKRSMRPVQQYRRDDVHSDYSDEEYRRRFSDEENEYKYRSSSSSKKPKRSRKHHRYDDYSDYSDLSDEYYRDSHRSSSSRRSGSRRQYNRDDYSDYSDNDDRRDKESSFSKSKSRKSREEEKSSKKKRKHRSRSHSKDSKDSKGSRERDKDKSKKKKKDKKDKKRKHHRKDGSGDESRTPSKPPPNVLVGKVGKVGSFRTLGQKKSVSNDEEATKAATTEDTPTTQEAPQVGEPGKTDAQKSALQQQPSTQPQQLPAQPNQAQASDPYYQQPYYSQAAYSGYDTPAYGYQQQQAWQWGDQAYSDPQYAGVPYSGDQYSQGYVQGSGAQYVQGDQIQQGQMGEAAQQMEGVGSEQQASGMVSGQQTVELEEEEAIAECEMEIEDNTPEESPGQVADAAASMQNETPKLTPGGVEEQSATDPSAAVVEAAEIGKATETEIVPPRNENETTQSTVAIANEPLPPVLQEPSVQPLNLPSVDTTEQPVPPESDQVEMQTTPTELVAAPEPPQEEKSIVGPPATAMEPVFEPLSPEVETVPPPVPGEEATASVPDPPPQPLVDDAKKSDSSEPPTGTKPEIGASSESIPPPPLPEMQVEARKASSADTGGASTPPPPGTEPEPNIPPPPPPPPLPPPPPPPPGTGTGELTVEAPVGEDAYQVPSDDETGAPTTVKESKQTQNAPTPDQPQEATQESQTAQATPSQESVSSTAETTQPATTNSTSETAGYTFEGQPQISSTSYNYETTSTAPVEIGPGAYIYTGYSQPSDTMSQQGYDYSAYAAQAQAAGYNYAYNAYLQQQAAASYSGYTLASDGQYYPTAAYGGYAGVGGGNPYTGYYGGGNTYGTTPGYQVAQQQAAATTALQQGVAQPLTAEDKKGKKSDFALAVSKEKQMKSMMEKWSSFKGP